MDTREGIIVNFAQRLRELREKRGITQEMLSEALGIARASIAGYETKLRIPRQKTLRDIAEYFDVTIDYLLGYDEDATEDIEPTGFPQRLKATRESKGWTQKKVADAIGISQQFYGRFEKGTGEPNIKSLSRLSEVLAVSLDYLINGEIEHIIAQPKEVEHWQERALNAEAKVASLRGVIKHINKLTQEEI
jgi:transcriptional regulator with XRE-family HTH domain